MIEALAIAGIITGTVVVGVAIFMREWENARQRQERHRLKNENAALRMLLKHHGIDPPEGE